MAIYINNCLKHSLGFQGDCVPKLLISSRNKERGERGKMNELFGKS